MTATATVTRWCQRRGIELIRINPALFLQQLSEQLAGRSRSPEPPGQVAAQSVPARAAVPLPDRPYKLLDYYRTEDAAIFFGRDQDAHAQLADPRAPAGHLVRGIGNRQDLVDPGGRARACITLPALRHAAHPGAGGREPSLTIQAAFAGRLGKDAMPAPGSARLVDALTRRRRQRANRS